MRSEGKGLGLLEPPISMSGRGRKVQRGEAVVTKRRPRRTAYEMVQELKARREELARIYEARLSKLDSRIERLEERFEKKIMVTELLHSKTSEELEQELQAVKKRQALLKKALKAQR